MIVSDLDKSWPWFKSVVTKTEMQNPEKLVQEAMRFSRGARELCFSRRRAVSCGGYAAQVPLATQVGDLIFLPLGSPIPFIIRSSDSRRDHFELIGECYVHGIMNGEAIGEKSDVVDINMM